MTAFIKASAEELKQILQSETITLVPSNSDTSLKIHRRLLSVAPPLQAACEMDLKEKIEKKYKFEGYDEGKDDAECFVDVTEDMLICFITWTYLGDYSTEAVGISSAVEEHLKEMVDGGWGSCWSSKKGKKKGGKGSLRKEPELEEPPVEEANLLLDSEPADNPGILAKYPRIGPPKHFHPLFFHVRMYIFASIYLIGPLKILSMQKIIDYLKKVENSRDNYTNVTFDLLEYAFSNLPDGNNLLDWLVKYSIWKLGSLKSDLERLDHLLGIADGKFARLLVRHVAPSQDNPFRGFS